jgi:hypothetical protein
MAVYDPIDASAQPRPIRFGLLLYHNMFPLTPSSSQRT